MTSGWNGIVTNSDTGDIVEGKLDSAFGNIDTEIDKIPTMQTEIDAKVTSTVTDALDVRVTDVETKTDFISVTANADLDVLSAEVTLNTASIDALSNGEDIVSVMSGPKTVQTVVADTAEILDYMTSTVANVGTSITHDVNTDAMLVVEAGVYEVFGTINITAPINDIVDIEMYIDNLPTGFKASSIGRGSVITMAFTNTFMYGFSANDDIHLYVTSTGTEITLQSASMTVKKTKY